LENKVTPPGIFIIFCYKNQWPNAIYGPGKNIKPVRQIYLEEPVMKMYTEQHSCSVEVRDAERKPAADKVESIWKLHYELVVMDFGYLRRVTT
jgi:hypothetical protein